MVSQTRQQFISSENQIAAGIITNASISASAAIGRTKLQGKNSVTATPADPTGTTSATDVMMGLAISITPVALTKVIVKLIMQHGNNAQNFCICWGTGAPPANGAAITGTILGSQYTLSGSGISSAQDTLIGEITGLTPGVAIWVDLAGSASIGTWAPTKITAVLQESE